jgi:hypothetical protein
MKSICNWEDLRPYGIDFLTGEACSLMFRLLLDVNERGRKVLARFFGAPNLKLGDPWNGGTPEEPHVASIMLTREMLLPIAVFALLEHGCDEVYLYQDRVVGFEACDSPEVRQRHLHYYRHHAGRRFSYGPTRDRNLHRMTQRTD